MYYRSGGKRKIIEKINILESSEEYTKLQNISPVILFMAIALEDKEFFRHRGINIKSVEKAIIVNMNKRRIVMGGSTITQQLAKNLLFDFKKTYTRKIAEIFAVVFLENKYSKEKILEVYLNCIQFGDNKIGINAACNYYFAKLPSDIKLSQAISLITILPSPKNYSPIRNPERYYKVRSSTVDLLKNEKYIREMESSCIKESEYLSEDLFDSNIERFYREIYKNSIRAAKVNKTILRVDIDSQVAGEILSGEFTSEGLVDYAYNCLDNLNTTYMWGGMMDIIGEDIIQTLSKRYKKYYTKGKITYYEDLIGEDVYGCDCSGLIKSYLFRGLNHPSYEELYDMNSNAMYYVSEYKGKIDCLPEIKGISLYKLGHVGIYVGNGKVIECTDSEQFGNGVVESNLGDRDWTDWFYCPFATY